MHRRQIGEGIDRNTERSREAPLCIENSI
jgi:hypothetical protein